ncbi:DUF4400 domain-containing protein [Thiorhodovibrio frisius]|uniref:Integrating conjugative element membrane protein, PFL_4697 family n=1 Tax=Thiorhodovibrio frisius TaxID=631362 RepID=H8YVG4_9GAMM|nr:DUF4400 domain-containing protein [Thiorhodovibrio frisius]EIC23904.1 hypothetical protein Thi970DRAFT_00039 [Thiorhodovibrio frisius]WPL23153.1 integrating conjugative element membrane protein, family [Thiorhodovibrio frisius]
MASEREARSGWLWGITVAVILFVMEFILLSALVPTEWSSRVQKQEAEWMEQTLGARTAQAIFEQSEAWSERLFVRSGLMAGSYDLLIPDDVSVERAPELGKLAESPVWPLIQDRLDVIWQSLDIAVQRIVLLLAWWPFLAFALVGGILDGLLRRRIRQSGFDYPSPLAHRLAVGALLWMGVAVSLCLLLPVPIPVVVVPMVAISIAVAVGAMVTQTQKRL